MPLNFEQILVKKFGQFIFSFPLTMAFLIAASLCLASPNADHLLKSRGFVWQSATSEHFRLHFEPNTWAENRIEDLKRWQENAYRKNLQLLRVSDYPYQTDVFVVSSRERMKQLIGDQVNGVAFSDTKVICFVFSEKIYAGGSHELMHIMAGNTWNRKSKSWINEGFAVYSDDAWYRYNLHDLNKYLLQQGNLVPLEKLVKNFSDYPDMITYPEAGSFVKYICEQYGAEKVRALWKDGTVKDIKRILGKDIATLEKEWHARLMEADASNVTYKFPLKK